MLLLEVDPESLHFEDDAVVFSYQADCRSHSVAAPEYRTSICFFCCAPGFYTTSRDSKTGGWAVRSSHEALFGSSSAVQRLDEGDDPRPEDPPHQSDLRRWMLGAPGRTRTCNLLFSTPAALGLR